METSAQPVSPKSTDDTTKENSSGFRPFSCGDKLHYLTPRDVILTEPIQPPNTKETHNCERLIVWKMNGRLASYYYKKTK